MASDADFRSDPLYCVLIPLLAEELGVARNDLQPATRLYHDLDVNEDAWEKLMRRLGREFGVNLIALNGELHWPTKQPFWSRLVQSVGADYFPITVSDLAEWIRAGEFNYDYAGRKAVPHPSSQV